MSLLSLTRSLVQGFFAFSFLVGAPAAYAASFWSHPDSVRLTYEFHVGLFHVLTVEAEAEFDGNSYEIRSTSVTRGIADLFFRLESSVEARGVLGEIYPEPAYYVQRSGSRRGDRLVEMTYDDSGRIELTVDPEPEQSDATLVTAEQRSKTVDPISAFLIGSIESRGNPCDQNMPVFDGRRRFDLRFVDADSESPHLAVADGSDIQQSWCRVEFDPVAGFEPIEEATTRAVRRGRGRRPAAAARRDDWQEGTEPGYVLIGSFPGLTLSFPLRGETESDFGTVRAELIRLEIDGESILEEDVLRRPSRRPEASDPVPAG